MIGTKKLSTIKEELRQAFAESASNPIVDLDREIRKLKKSKSKDVGELATLETFREALAEIVNEKTAKRARPQNARRTKKAV